MDDIEVKRFRHAKDETFIVCKNDGIFIFLFQSFPSYIPLQATLWEYIFTQAHSKRVSTCIDLFLYFTRLYFQAIIDLTIQRKNGIYRLFLKSFSNKN